MKCWSVPDIWKDTQTWELKQWPRFSFKICENTAFFMKKKSCNSTTYSLQSHIRSGRNRIRLQDTAAARIRVSATTLQITIYDKIREIFFARWLHCWPCKFNLPKRKKMPSVLSLRSDKNQIWQQDMFLWEAIHFSVKTGLIF